MGNGMARRDTTFNAGLVQSDLATVMRQPIAQLCKPCMLLSKSSYAGICHFAEYASLQAEMYATYCHRCAETRSCYSFALC